MVVYCEGWAATRLLSYDKGCGDGILQAVGYCACGKGVEGLGKIESVVEEAIVDVDRVQGRYRRYGAIVELNVVID